MEQLESAKRQIEAVSEKGEWFFLLYRRQVNAAKY